MSRSKTVVNPTRVLVMYMMKGKTNYFVVALSEHTEAIKVELESGDVREYRIRKSYGWDGIELGTCQSIANRENEVAGASPRDRASSTS
jgi:hypothetical protein